MLNHLQAASRLLVRASLALFTAVVLLLLQSAFWSNRVSGWMQIVLLATALLSYFRPQYGLLALAALVPFGRIGSGTLDSQMRGAEALVLAFLAGALVRGWTLREFRSFPSTRLETAALIFGFIIAASCLEQIWFLQIQRDFPLPFLQELVTYASRNYLTSYRGFGMIFNAMLLLEGLALLCLTVRFGNEQAAFGRRVIVMIVGGAVAVVLLTVGYGLAAFFQAAPAQMTVVEFFTHERWSVHIGDVNAAGSFFAMAMFIAFAHAPENRRHFLLWSVSGILLAGALWLTYSRTALVAVALIAVCVLATTLLGRILGIGKTVAMTAIGLTGMMVAAWRLVPHQYFGAGAENAVAVRRVFLEVTGKMLADYPFFGVGIGQYGLWSHHYAVPEMFEYYQRENAHNNFAQVAGELGLVGLAAFLIVLCASLWFRSDSRKGVRVSMPLLLGLAAFVLTWLGGHPLLVPEVAYPFWITLGAAAAFISMGGAPRMPEGLMIGAAAILLISVPFRVHAKTDGIDFSRVQYGLSNGRLTASRARLFVPADRTHIEFPLRARAASEDQPVVVDLFVDDTMTKSVRMTDRSWQRTSIELPAKSSAKFHELELRVRPPESDDPAYDPRRDDVEVGNWEIIAKPNG